MIEKRACARVSAARARGGVYAGWCFPPPPHRPTSGRTSPASGVRSHPFSYHDCKFTNFALIFLDILCGRTFGNTGNKGGSVARSYVITIVFRELSRCGLLAHCLGYLTANACSLSRHRLLGLRPRPRCSLPEARNLQPLIR